MGRRMKIPFGFVLGFVAGAYVSSKLTEEQRAGLTDKVDKLATTGRTGKIVESVRRNVGDVADVATDRVTDVTETVGDTAAAKLSGEERVGANASSVG